MAFINGNYNHPVYSEIEIQVQEPVKGESDYSEGRKVSLELESMETYSTRELKRIAKWIIGTCREIEKTFDKKGRKK